MFTGKGVAELLDEQEPVCAEDTLLLKTLYSGLSNGTERSFLIGGPYGGRRWPTRIAYQLVSEVVECGAKVKRFRTGDTVLTGTFPGHVEYHLAREGNLIARLPDDLDRRSASLLGVAAVSYHDVRRAKVNAEDSVLVIGDGLIGQFAAQAARLCGARVLLAGHHDDRLAAARDIGLETLNTVGDEGRAQVKGRAPFSVIMECSGADVFDWIMGDWGRPGLVGRRSRARLVLVAGRDEVHYRFGPAGMTEIDILHTQHFDQCDLDDVVELAAEGKLQVEPLIRDVVPLSEAPRVYETLRDNPSQLFGTVFAVAAA
jgi:2-desacetyl-2-hydroxyethyl bacteriochlorophyllide A dehydrogenase